MYELIYTSVANMKFDDKSLIRLLNIARSRNQGYGITGMLIYYNQEFIQLLEGPKTAVEQVFPLIRDDDKHRTINVVYEGDIQSRAFANWSMAFKSVNHINELVTDGYRDISHPISLGDLCYKNPNVGREIFMLHREMLLGVTQ
ncbi:BLUF domain-containing protein [Pleionea sp. CnH1-48]|uniref:BLUF domain-containing protein n=1 Tax=Pleionea sp. CnH1-48 TaxID=2954494 RepID=UPI002112CABE|nr:BLUF domain-containing protein [Pleionea sp. CnH1-48]